MIQRISVLENLVDLDRNEHELKHLAALLLKASNDWPNEKVKDLDSLISEFKAYFGDPLSVEKIESRSFNGLNAWQLESGKSLVQLLKRAEKQFKLVDLDLLVSKMQRYYTCEFEKVDFVAEIKMFRTENGGIKSFVPNGYKPNMRFQGHEKSVMGQLSFDKQDLLYAGELVIAKVKLFDSKGYESFLEKGLNFEISNSNSIVGQGIIQQVVNVDLKKENWMESFAKNSIFAMI